MLVRFTRATVAALHFHFIRWWREYALLIFILLCACSLTYLLFLSPPSAFPTGQVITIETGESLPAIAAELATLHAIRSPLAFEVLVRVLGGARTIDAGAYRFVVPLSAPVLALRLERGETGIPPVRITFPEGESASQMATLIAPQFSITFANAFLKLAAPEEGYLFPDTYLFSPKDTPASVVAHMRANFDIKIMPLLPAVNASGHSLADIVAMASLLEREAKTPQDMRIVAGILWKRLSLGMALQVDAAPQTYETTGLPLPIANPGLVALTAAALPATTTYLYYLTGSDGEMHYAATFAEHQANLEKYLK